MKKNDLKITSGDWEARPAVSEKIRGTKGAWRVPVRVRAEGIITNAGAFKNKWTGRAESPKIVFFGLAIVWFQEAEHSQVSPMRAMREYKKNYKRQYREEPSDHDKKRFLAQLKRASTPAAMARNADIILKSRRVTRNGKTYTARESIRYQSQRPTRGKKSRPTLTKDGFINAANPGDCLSPRALKSLGEKVEKIARQQLADYWADRMMKSAITLPGRAPKNFRGKV